MSGLQRRVSEQPPQGAAGDAAIPVDGGRLASVARDIGTRVVSSANQPIALDEPGTAWYCAEGALDLFVHESGHEMAVGRRHLLRVEAGQAAFGLADPAGQLAVSAKGLPGTVLYGMAIDDLIEMQAAERRPATSDPSSLAHEIAQAAETWVEALSASVAGRVQYRPAPTGLMQPRTAAVEVDGGDVLSARSGCVVWLRVTDAPQAEEPETAEAPLSGAELALFGTETPGSGAAGWLPLTSQAWATVSRDAVLETRTTAHLSASGVLLRALDGFHALAFGAESVNRLLAVADEVNEQSQRAASRMRARDDALDLLSSAARQGRPPRGSSSPVGTDAQLESVMSVIADFEGFALSAVRPAHDAAAGTQQPGDLLAGTDVRVRDVTLPAAQRWWRVDGGALLAFLADDCEPVALLPRGIGGYAAVDARGRRRRVGARFARTLDGRAWQFYPPLPAERSVGIRDLFRMGRRKAGTDTVRFVGAGLLTGLSSQAPALALGILTGGVLAFGASSALASVVTAVGVFSALALLGGLASSTALMRVECRSAARVEAAVWSRLLRLPPRFFRSSITGELVSRMSAIRGVRDSLAGAVARSSLASVFAAPTFAVLMLYDFGLGSLSLTVAAAAAAVIVGFSLRLLRHQRVLSRAHRRLVGRLLSIINGSSKIRSAGAQGPAFWLWAREFRDVQAAVVRRSRIAEHLGAFGAALPVIAGSLLVGAAAADGAQAGVADFVVIFAASMTFFAAMAQFAGAAESLTALLPAYEQVQPILDALPEPAGPQHGTAALRGDVRADRVSFRYDPDGPLVLDDVSIHAQPGEFIAVVGGSGSGKSTLIKLLLGLEEPESGSVLFDGNDLRRLDRQSVRRQIGTVSQDSILAVGTLLDNIAGVARKASVADAWEAARLASLDRDIEAMPLQMLTPVSDRATTFSGGQAQRVRIAAALASKPRLLFFDEATSWLDAASQAEVMANIETLALTRVVVAHRLSTIRSADRIYVLEAGRVVQNGTFAELSSVDGPFNDLVRRQQV